MRIYRNRHMRVKAYLVNVRLAKASMGRPDLEGQVERVRQESGERRRNPAGLDEPLEEVRCAGLFLREGVPGREVGALQVLDQRMISGIAAWRRLQAAPFHRQRVGERL